MCKPAQLIAEAEKEWRDADFFVEEVAKYFGRGVCKALTAAITDAADGRFI